MDQKEIDTLEHYIIELQSRFNFLTKRLKDHDCGKDERVEAQRMLKEIEQLHFENLNSLYRSRGSRFTAIRGRMDYKMDDYKY